MNKISVTSGTIKTIQGALKTLKKNKVKPIELYGMSTKHGNYLIGLANKKKLVLLVEAWVLEQVVTTKITYANLRPCLITTYSGYA